MLSILGSVASCNSLRCKRITIRWLLLGRDCKRKRYKRKTIRDSDKIFQNYAQYSNAKDNNYIVGVINFGDAQWENYINFFHFEGEKCQCTAAPSKNDLENFPNSMLDDVEEDDILVSVNGIHIDKNSIENFKRLVRSTK